MRIGSLGLSPRVRGNHTRTDAAANVLGSIPACAGEPRMLNPRMESEGVYPRVCGGTEEPLGKTVAIEGLSPRVRGNRYDLPTQIENERSIPACAGEPPLSPR